MVKFPYFVIAAFPDGSVWSRGRKYCPPYKAGSVESGRTYVVKYSGGAVRGKDIR